MRAFVPSLAIALALAFALAFAAAACTTVPVRERPCPEPARDIIVKTATVVEPPKVCSFAALRREERRIASAPGIEVLVMRIAAFGDRRGAVVFTHGAGSPSSASWDLAHGEYSFMRRLACAGFDAYAVDIRGFGGSTIIDALKGAPEAAPPAVRASDAIIDVDAAVSYATATSTVATIDLIGWSWGSDVAGMYAGTRPERVRRLVLMSPVYDRRWPARHQTTRAWYPLTRAELEKAYPPDREERAIWDTFTAAMFRFTTGDTLRLPNGPYRDIYGEDAPLWDAKKITAPTLVLRGEKDAASLDQHALALFRDLGNARSKRYLVLGGLAHFVHRERRFRETHDAVTSFLLSPDI